MASTTAPTVPPIHFSHERYYVKQGRTDTAFVPETFSDLYQHYYGYVVRLIVGRGIDPLDADDIAQTILTHFFRHDALSDFEPDRGNRFGSFLSGFVLKYLLHHLDMQSKRKVREPFSVDRVVNPEGADDERTWLQLQGGSYDFEAEGVEYLDTVQTIRERLADMPARSSQDRCDLPALFEMVREQVDTAGEIDVVKIAQHFGVAQSTVQAWMRRMREAIR